MLGCSIASPEFLFTLALGSKLPHKRVAVRRLAAFPPPNSVKYSAAQPIGMNVNAKVDMAACLREIPGLTLIYQTSWKIRLLQIQGQSLALSALLQWAQTSRYEFEEIMKGIRLVGINRLPPELPAVEKSPHFPVYAIRAKGSAARLIYFYVAEINTVVCTNCIEPGVLADVHIGYAFAERLRCLFQESLPQPLPLT